MRAQQGYAPEVMAASATIGGFGGLLREWRQRRKLSQLELSLDSSVSARHLSFIETGRARASRELVVRLAETLQVPLRERNALLIAAGYAPIYSESSLQAEQMEPVRRALDRFLRAHEPYPALVVDRHHNLLSANDALAALTAGCASHLLEPPANAIRLALHPEGMALRTLNLGEWSAHLIARLRRELAATGDPELAALFSEVCGYPGVQSIGESDGVELFVPLKLRHEQEELSFVSTISTFGSAVDITLAELSVEAFYPANAQTAARMLAEISG